MAPSTFKGKNTNRSWMHLPPEIVRLIVTHVLLDVSFSAFVPSTWEHREQWLSRMAYSVIRDADVIEQLMMVCPAWQQAIETHLFWQHAASVLDPHDTLVGATRGNMRISPYRHFRQNILNRCCMPCRVNHPTSSLGILVAKRQTYTHLLGPVWTCKDHRKDKFCGVCLRDANDQSLTGNEDVDTWAQIDSTCANCRAEWLLRAVKDNPRELEAIGGRGFKSQDWEVGQALGAFIDTGEGTIHEIVALALEKQWLRTNTKIVEMLDQALAASRYQTREDRQGFGAEDAEELSDEDDDFEFISMTEDAGGVRDLAMNDWARGRILEGHWYSPADQWQALQTTGVNHIIGPVVQAIHPCPWNISPHDALGGGRGAVNPNGEPDHPSAAMVNGEVPPSFALCNTAYEAFRRQMLAVLMPAMTNLVRKIVIESVADGIDPCIRAAKMDIEDVAKELRDEGVWYNGIDWLLRRENGERERKEKARVVREREHREQRDLEKVQKGKEKDESDDSTSTSSKSDGSHTTSPVLSTSTLQTTPSPPPIISGDDTPSKKSRTKTNLALPIAIAPVLSSPTLIPSIPYVPVNMAEMPPYTIETLKSVWRDACAPLYQCKCGICERAILKANIAVGNVFGSQFGSSVPSVPSSKPIEQLPAGITAVTKHIYIEEEEEEEEEDFEDEEELVAHPFRMPSPDEQSLQSVGRKRSSEEIDEEDADMEEVVVDSNQKDGSASRGSTPPKRARKEDSQENIIQNSRRVQKRRSEELDDPGRVEGLEGNVRNAMGMKRARKGESANVAQDRNPTARDSDGTLPYAPPWQTADLPDVKVEMRLLLDQFGALAGKRDPSESQDVRTVCNRPISNSRPPSMHDGAEEETLHDGSDTHPRQRGASQDLSGPRGLSPHPLRSPPNPLDDRPDFQSLIEEFGPQSFAQASQAIYTATESLYRAFTEMQAGRFPAHIADEDVAMSDLGEAVQRDADSQVDRQT